MSSGSSPAMMASIAAQQATVGARGPTESSENDSGSTPPVGIRFAVGL